MTSHTNHSAAKHRYSAPLIIIAALVGLVALTGCTAGNPGSSPTPTATADASTPTPTPAPTRAPTSAPQSAEEATRAAEAALDEFMSVSNAVTADGGKDSDRLAAVAITPAQEEQVKSAKEIAANGYVSTGSSVLEVQSSDARDLTDGATAVPFGSVNIKACYDSSGRKMKKPDGSDAPLPTDSRTLRDVQVVYVTAESSWFVRVFTKEPATC